MGQRDHASLGEIIGRKMGRLGMSNKNICVDFTEKHYISSQRFVILRRFVGTVVTFQEYDRLEFRSFVARHHRVLGEFGEGHGLQEIMQVCLGCRAIVLGAPYEHSSWTALRD